MRRRDLRETGRVERRSQLRSLVSRLSKRHVRRTYARQQGPQSALSQGSGRGRPAAAHSEAACTVRESAKLLESAPVPCNAAGPLPGVVRGNCWPILSLGRPGGAPAARRARADVACLRRVLRPYFWPDGALNRFRAVMCFFILGCSKTANILAPIFIGRAINKLSEENRVPVADIVAYCSACARTAVWHPARCISACRGAENGGVRRPAHCEPGPAGPPVRSRIPRQGPARAPELHLPPRPADGVH